MEVINSIVFFRKPDFHNIRMKDFERIKYALKARGLSHREVAEACNVERSAVTQWCNGNTNPSVANYRTLAKVTKTRLAWLIDEDGDMTDDDSLSPPDFLVLSDETLFAKVIEIIDEKTKNRRDSLTSEQKTQMIKTLYKELCSSDINNDTLDIRARTLADFLFKQIKAA